jgi:hypothetical protein
MLDDQGKYLGYVEIRAVAEVITRARLRGARHLVLVGRKRKPVGWKKRLRYVRGLDALDVFKLDEEESKVYALTKPIEIGYNELVGQHS